MQDRRRFLMKLLAGTTALSVAPGPLSASPESDGPDPTAGPGAGFPPAPPAKLDEAYWEIVKRSFPLADGVIVMNAANLCPSPFVVQERVFQLTRDLDGDVSFQNRAKFEELREAARNAIGNHIGADPDEVAITRNTSEGNNTVVAGVDLGPGDEVVIWDQNHPTNSTSWDVRAERVGFSVKRVATPTEPGSTQELSDVFASALSPQTRILAFSHVSNATGVALPADELCAIARDRGILTLVDGAQTCGAMELDLHAMGCDFYTTSSHKWLTGPKEAGILYVRRDRTADLWAADVGVGWEGALDGGARKFENLGQRDDACVSALETAVAFQTRLGMPLIEARIRELAGGIRVGLSQTVPGIAFVTPGAEDRSLGVVVFRVPGSPASEVFQRLYLEHGVGCAAMGENIRLSPHVYNTMEDVERVVAAIAQLQR